MKEKLILLKNKIIGWLMILFWIIGISVVFIFILKLLFNMQLPSWSWWSSTLLSDNKTKSIITEVESSGYNMRTVQYIDAFGRVCTNAYVQGGQAGMDCDFPSEDKKDWTIEDYKKALKAKK